MSKKGTRKLIVVNAASIAAAAGIPVESITPTTTAPVASSGANRTMTYLPRVIATAVESAHSALKHLAEVSGPAFATQEREGRRAQVETLLNMLGDINECLVARHNGAKNLTNAMIDEALVKAGVKEPLPVKGQAGAVGYKAGASRHIGIVTFENPLLWTDKNRQALGAIKATGIQFEAQGEVFKSPFEAIRAGHPWSSVYKIWAATVRNLNQQVTPSAVVTKFDRLSKQIVSLSLDERRAMLAALFVTIPQPPAEPVAETTEPTAEAAQG